jgi:hypothetical protein
VELACSWKIKEIPASLTLLASPMQHKEYSDNVNDNIDDFFLLVNKKLLDCMCFTDKQQLGILLQISQSAYFHIYFQLLLV